MYTSVEPKVEILLGHHLPSDQCATLISEVKQARERSVAEAGELEAPGPISSVNNVLV